MDHTTASSSASIAVVTKTVYIIRHGVALHNVLDARTGERPDLRDPRYADSPLIHQGELQARVLGEQLRRRRVIRENISDDGSKSYGDGMNADGDAKKNHPKPIDLVVCSPLMRCLQTASLVFPWYFEIALSSSTGAESISTDAHCDLALHGNYRVCCHGDVREAYGMHYPDKRRPLSQLKSKFPTIAYHPSVTEVDSDWQPDTRESREDVMRRVHNFFIWLLQQPYDNIAIVTHGVWMECALLAYCPEALEFGKKRVYNCEAYQGQLVGGLSFGGNRDDGGGVALKDVEQIAFYHV